MSQPSKKHVKLEHELIAYAEHWDTATKLLDRAVEQKRGAYHQRLAALAFMAFSFEALLNHIGERLFECWDDLETLNVPAKVNVICEKIGVKPDYGSVPWQVVPRLVAFRNQLVHSKDEILREEARLYGKKYEEFLNTFLKTNWQKEAAEDKVAEIRTQLEQLCRKLWDSSGQNPARLFATGFQHGSTKV